MKAIDIMNHYGRTKEVKCKNGEIQYKIKWIETDKSSLVLEQKINKTYYFLHISDNKTEIYRRLAQELISKNINKCTYIKRISRSPLYNGYQRIYVTYDNNIRATYTIIQN